MMLLKLITLDIQKVRMDPERRVSKKLQAM